MTSECKPPSVPVLDLMVFAAAGGAMIGMAILSLTIAAAILGRILSWS